MNFKFLLVLFLATALLVSMSEAGKDRRKKQKQKERQEDNDAEDETAGGRGIEESGKAKDEKERTSVLEKQAEKKTDDDESSSEEDEDDEKKDNSTVIIRKRRDTGVALPTDAAETTRIIHRMIRDLERNMMKTFGEVTMDRFKRQNPPTQMKKTQEINDGVQLPLDKKPSATASPTI
ncbi:hypothetical protein B9Z55_023643 [Caenorhabditis nigoni]|uniref:Uncharacterized protein n=1 Tax=Caenorhabditis nigoni TaxID=1611254 RepID=A0A2G5SQM7_9PELO|nr:hypothetical protein B9Z55_023643 [Caenorhabditis nigoni]